MSKKELIRIVCRAFSLLLITWALVELTYLPERIYSLYHYHGGPSVLYAGRDFWKSYDLLAVAMLLVRLVAFVVAASMFWRCGPGVESLFSRQAGGEQD